MSGAKPPVVAGVDSSTQSTKVELRELESGAVVGRASSPHPEARAPRSEQDPAAWWEAFTACWDGLGAPPVAGVSVAAQQHGAVVLDAAGDVLRPAKLWNDTECAPDAAWLRKQLPGGAADWAAACGSVPVAAFTIAKLSWLHRSEPEVWERLAHVMLPHDWLTFRLTGRRCTDRGDASGTGYWSPAAGEYCWDLLAIVDRERDWTGVVPEVLAPDEPAGTWAGAVVAPGTGDNMAAALGLGLAPGEVAVSIGTSGTVFTVTEAPTHDATGAVAGFASADGRFLPLVCTLNAARVTDAVGRLLGVSHDALDDLALAAEPGCGGLTLLPYFDGERTPDRPGASGVLAGLRSDVSRERLARAAFEGVVCSLLDGLDALEAHVPGGRELVVVGGGARSTAYPRLLADLSGHPVRVVAHDEVVATGAAVQAAAAVTGEPPAAVADRWSLATGQLVEPALGEDERSAVRAAYAALRDG